MRHYGNAASNVSEPRMLKLERKDLKMLKPSHLGLSLALFLCHPPAHAESATNKCTDGNEITYSNLPCEKLGLKTIGPVKNAITVVPAIHESGKEPSENPGKNDASGTDAPETGKIKPMKSLLERMMQ
jgi:hypothetical protein